MKAIVHIGMPKCGSSSIQGWLDLNKAALSQQGIAFDNRSMPGYQKTPANLGIKVCQNHALGGLSKNNAIRIRHKVFTLEDQRQYAEAYTKFFESMVRDREEETFVVSSEYLGADRNGRRGVEAVEEWLSRFFDEVRYIVYFRRQEDWLASAYSERMKHGNSGTLQEFVAKSAEQNWYAKAALWADTVGSERIDVRLMERDALTGGDLIADFAGLIGADAGALTDAPKRNVSLTAPAAEILRAVNAQLDHTVEGDRKINPRKAAIRRTLLAQDLGVPRIRLDPAQVDAVRAANAASNEKLRARFFAERSELFPRAPDPEESANLRVEDIVKVAADLALNVGKDREETGPKARRPKAGGQKKGRGKKAGAKKAGGKAAAGRPGRRAQRPAPAEGGRD